MLSQYSYNSWLCSLKLSTARQELLWFQFLLACCLTFRLPCILCPLIPSRVFLAPTRRTTCSRRKPPSQRGATDQKDQSPQPLRQCVARGTLLGIQGNRMQGSLKVKRHVRKSQNQSSSCRALDSFSERNQELSEYVS